MRKLLKTLTMEMVCIAMTVCVSCKKDNAEPGGTGGGSTQTVATVTTNDVTEVTATTAVCGGEVTSENGCAVTQRGVCWGTNHNPTLSDYYTEDGEGIGKFTSTITELTADTKYYVRAYAKNAAGTSFGPENDFTTLSGSGTHEYVDLGLPSGLLWATCNVGATNPEDYGDYFAWGEIEPYYADGHSQDSTCSNWRNMTTGAGNTDITGYDWHTYNQGGSDDFVEWATPPYNSNNVLKPERDAAHVNWGGDWRMPTKEEWKELRDNTTSKWTTQNGVYGRLFTSTVAGYTEASLFLPADGCRYRTLLNYVDFLGQYWTSSRDASNPDYAHYMYFLSDGVSPQNISYRCQGFTVRPVR